MSQNDTLAKALTDVRSRVEELQADHDRIVGELSKLRLAERSLAALVEGGSLDDLGSLLDEPAGASPRVERSANGARLVRKPRGPRANSAKGRLRTLLETAGPQGLSQVEIARRLADVAPTTLNAYLSTMVSGGEAIRRGDFYTAARPSAPETEPSEEEASSEDPESTDDASEDDVGTSP